MKRFALIVFNGLLLLFVTAFLNGVSAEKISYSPSAAMDAAEVELEIEDISPLEPISGLDELAEIFKIKKNKTFDTWLLGPYTSSRHNTTMLVAVARAYINDEENGRPFLLENGLDPNKPWESVENFVEKYLPARIKSFLKENPDKKDSFAAYLLMRLEGIIPIPPKAVFEVMGRKFPDFFRAASFLVSRNREDWRGQIQNLVELDRINMLSASSIPASLSDVRHTEREGVVETIEDDNKRTKEKVDSTESDKRDEEKVVAAQKDDVRSKAPSNKSGEEKLRTKKRKMRGVVKDNFRKRRVVKAETKQKQIRRDSIPDESIRIGVNAFSGAGFDLGLLLPRIEGYYGDKGVKAFLKAVRSAQELGSRNACLYLDSYIRTMGEGVLSAVIFEAGDIGSVSVAVLDDDIASKVGGNSIVLDTRYGIERVEINPSPASALAEESLKFLLQNESFSIRILGEDERGVELKFSGRGLVSSEGGPVGLRDELMRAGFPEKAIPSPEMLPVEYLSTDDINLIADVVRERISKNKRSGKKIQSMVESIVDRARKGVLQERDRKFLRALSAMLDVHFSDGREFLSGFKVEDIVKDITRRDLLLSRIERLSLSLSDFVRPALSKSRDSKRFRKKIDDIRRYERRGF